MLAGNEPWHRPGDTMKIPNNPNVVAACGDEIDTGETMAVLRYVRQSGPISLVLDGREITRNSGKTSYLLPSAPSKDLRAAGVLTFLGEPDGEGQVFELAFDPEDPPAALGRFEISVPLVVERSAS